MSANLPVAGLAYSAPISSRGAVKSKLHRNAERPSTKRHSRFAPISVVIALVFGGFWYGSVYQDRTEVGLGSGAAEAELAAIDYRPYYTIANVRLRTAPSTSSEIIIVVPAGTVVQSSGREGDWHGVHYGDYSGWVFGDYLKEQTPDKLAPRSETERLVQNNETSGSKLISGRASVIDGDTIEIAKTRVRFNGIDAPEGAQFCRDAKGNNYRCGQRAADALDTWLKAAQPVTCKFVEQDNHGRFVGDCYRSDGAAIAAWLVTEGHAVDWPRYSSGKYAALQAEARAARRGIWQGDFQLPWEWRVAEQTAARPSTAPIGLISNSCTIKGNINSKGERIYHVPGQRYYTQTRINSGAGERMFCSEEEARAAGWRRSRR